MDDRQHEWDVLEQGHPATSKPFGYVCGCGEVVVEIFPSLREAVRAARAHAGELVQRPAA
jgi:hypothetical protein